MSMTMASLRALSHPVRLQMLSLLTGASFSAAELARELGLTQANASYHLRTLLAAGVIRAAGTQKVRGGTAKRYRYEPDAPRDSEPGPGRDPGAEMLFAEALGEQLVRRSAHRRTDGRGTTTDAELWVTPELWHDLRNRVAAAMAELHRAARPPRTAGTVRVSATVALFEMHAKP